MAGRKLPSWDSRFMNLAATIASWSRDPSSQIGAVIVNPDTRNILSVGYNGFPRGIADDERLNNREEKYPLVVHAEMNAIYNASANGVSLAGSHMYVHGLPICHACSLGIIQSGIKHVTVMERYITNERWKESWERTLANFNEVGVEVHIIG